MAGKDDKNKKGFSGLSDLVSDINGANLVPSAKPEKTVNSPPVSKSTPTTPKLAVPLGTQSSPKTSPMSGKPSPNGWGGGSLGKGFFLAALVGFALYLAWLFSISNEDAKNSADNSQAASRNYTLGQSGAETPAPSANRAPQTPATQYEKPSVGRDNVLSIPQICWCLREDIRIEAMRDVADTEVGITKLNNLVEDYNSRCGSFRYREGALEQAKRTVEAHRSEIVATAVQEARQSLITPVRTDITLGRALQTPGYTPGQSVSFNILLEASGNTPVGGVAVVETIPPGWTFESVSGPTPPPIKPAVGAQGNLSFIFIDVPTFPATFTYTVKPSSDSAAEQEVKGKVLYRTEDLHFEGTELVTTLSNSRLLTGKTLAKSTAIKVELAGIDPLEDLDALAWELFYSKHPELKGRVLGTEYEELHAEWVALRHSVELTDYIFHKRHPELQGRKLLPKETELVNEWKSLSNAVKSPTLDESSRTPNKVKNGTTIAAPTLYEQQSSESSSSTIGSMVPANTNGGLWAYSSNKKELRFANYLLRLIDLDDGLHTYRLDLIENGIVIDSMELYSPEFDAVVDLTGDGYPEVSILTYSMGAHCCYDLKILELKDGIKTLVEVDGQNGSPYLKDLDGDGVAEVVTYDNTFCYWNASFSESYPTHIALTWQHSSLHLCESAMRDVEEKVFHLGWGRKISSTEALLVLRSVQEQFSTYESSLQNKAVWYPVPPALWHEMLRLIYSGRALEARIFLDAAWPKDKPWKNEFLSDFLSKLATSPYYNELLSLNNGKI